jgi:hypothetical protein
VRGLDLSRDVGNLFFGLVQPLHLMPPRTQALLGSSKLRQLALEIRGHLLENSRFEVECLERGQFPLAMRGNRLERVHSLEVEGFKFRVRG